MQKVGWLFMVPVFVTTLSVAQHVPLEKLGLDIQRSIPASWIVRDTTSGDLNKDGKADFALVMQNNSSANYKTNNDGLGYDSINSNERVLLVFFQTLSGYELIEKADKIVPRHESPTTDDPYWGVQIKKGILETGYRFWANAGSWYMFTTTYKFRFQSNDFYLIGIEYQSIHRASMEEEKISVNFSTRKAHFSTSVPTDDDIKTTSEWKTFKLDKLYKLTEVSPTTVKVLGKYL